MLYPKIFNIKKSNLLIKSLIIASVIFSIVLCLINYFLPTKYHWALLCVVGIIYTWIVTIYAIKKNTNIAYHVMIQMLCISFVLLAIDWILGQKGWSIQIGIPIIQMVANITLLILTIISRKRYYQYVIYQIIIFLLGTIANIGVIVWAKTWNVLYTIVVPIEIITLMASFLFCRKDFIEEVKKRFHI